MKRWLGFSLLLITLGASILRWPLLDRRPLHNDEAVNAYKTRALWETGQYRYDPNEHHGPALYYATLPFLWLSPARNIGEVSDRQLRLPPAFFGVLLVLLLWLIADGLGRSAACCAAIFTAVSPAMVFYSNYYIHEMLLVAFIFVVIAAGWRYTQNPHWGWALLAGVGLGLMYATKETFVIPVFSMALGLVLAFAWTWWREKQQLPLRAFWHGRHVLIAGAAAIGVSVLLFTSFFTNPSGPLDSIRTYAPWLGRARGNSPHIHPWYFYLERLGWFHLPRGPYWSEGAILLLATVGGIAGLLRRGLPDSNATCIRFLTFYTVVQAAIYSAIGYKTPWCMLGFYHGMILLAGVGAMVLVKAATAPLPRVVVSTLLVAATAHLGWEAWMAGTTYAADRKNPYVYAQTVPNILELTERVEELSRYHADGDRMVVKVMAPDGDYWPLPWYLRRLKQVGYYPEIPKAPDTPYAPVMVVGNSFERAFDEESNKQWLMVGLYELRPNVGRPRTFMELYVEAGLWKKFVETRPRPAQD